MKRLFAVICFLSIAGYADARMLPFMMSGGTSSTASTAYCTGAATCNNPPGDCDTICEDFEGSSECDADSSPDLDAACRAQYAVTLTTNGTADFTTAYGGTYPCGLTDNVNVLTLDYPATGDGAFVEWDGSSAKAITYRQFYFRLVSESLSNNQTIQVAQATVTSGTSTQTYYLSVKDVSGTLYAILTYYNSTPGWSTLPSSNGVTNQITVGNWYRVRIKFDYTNTAVQWYLGDEAFADTNPGNRPPRYFQFGDTNADNAADFQLDNHAIDISAYPAACAN